MTVENANIEFLEDGDAIITFPDELMEKLGWQEGDEIDITVEEGKIIFRKKQ